MPLFKSTKPPSMEEAASLSVVMPGLAGRPLEAPRFHKMKWRVGQRFAEMDDPDRTKEAWETPEFASHGDPASQRAETTVEELRVPRASPDRRFARVVRNVLSEEHSAELISRVNAKGFTPALLNIGQGKQELAPSVRDGHRVIVDSPELAGWLSEVLRPHLPERLDSGARLVGLNERCRFLCYTPGQSFEEHCDGCYRRPRGDPRAGDFSAVTVQLYLHDVPEACGGATRFFPGQSYSVAHQPETGSVLLFTQDLSHEGSLLREGFKYTLRTEAMYTHRRESLGGDLDG